MCLFVIKQPGIYPQHYYLFLFRFGPAENYDAFFDLTTVFCNLSECDVKSHHTARIPVSVFDNIS